MKAEASLVVVVPAVAVAVALALAGCNHAQQVGAGAPDRAPLTLKVTSEAFAAGAMIPKRHAYKGEGDNVSPPLAWSGAPPQTRSFALIVDDPDAPSPQKPRPDPWVHWVLYDLPPERTALAAGERGGGTPGKTDFGEQAWGGPMPPPGSGVHRYVFKVYALDARLGLAAGATKPRLLEAMQGHVLARGELLGRYERRRGEP